MVKNKRNHVYFYSSILAVILLFAAVILIVKWDNLRPGFAAESYESSKSNNARFSDSISVTSGLDGESSIILETGDYSNSIKVNFLSMDKEQYKLSYYTNDDYDAMRASKDVIMEERADEESSAYCYTAVMSNLEPNMEYVYQVSTFNEQKVSKPYTYINDANMGTFSFLFVGDPQIGAGNLETDQINWYNTLNVMRIINRGASFIISGGDQTDSADVEDNLKEYFAFRSHDVLKELPIMVVRGNHETDTELYDLQFNRQNQNAKYDYYFVKNDTLFVSLNTNNHDYGSHEDYLAHAIKETNPRWIVVMMHYSIFSAGPHADDESIIEGRDKYSEIFSKYNVDLVLSGHDHLYARSYLMSGDDSTGKDGGLKNTGETMYVTGNSASESKFYTDDGGNYPYLSVLKQEKVPYVTSIVVSRDSINISTYRVFDLKKIDSCVIRKN